MYIFLNKTDLLLSIHPHGVFHHKNDEGADGVKVQASRQEQYTYTWIADEETGSGPNDLSSIAWLYHFLVMAEEEMNLGLIDTTAITRQGKALSRDDLTSRDADQKFVS